MCDQSLKRQVEFLECDRAHLQSVIEIQDNQIRRLMDGRRAEQMLRVKTEDLLRQVFYYRTPLGEKLEDLISRDNPELWDTVFAVLSGQEKE